MKNEWKELVRDLIAAAIGMGLGLMIILIVNAIRMITELLESGIIS